MITFILVVQFGLMTSRFDRYNIKIILVNEIKDLMTRIKIHISKVKLPFYPPCEVKYGLQNGVSTTRLFPRSFLVLSPWLEVSQLLLQWLWLGLHLPTVNQETQEFPRGYFKCVLQRVHSQLKGSASFEYLSQHIEVFSSPF